MRKATWVDNEWISVEQARAIFRAYGINDDAIQSGSTACRTRVVLESLFVGRLLITWMGVNWDSIPRAVRLAGLRVATVGTDAMAMRMLLYCRSHAGRQPSRARVMVPAPNVATYLEFRSAQRSGRGRGPGQPWTVDSGVSQPEATVCKAPRVPQCPWRHRPAAPAVQVRRRMCRTIRCPTGRRIRGTGHGA